MLQCSYTNFYFLTQTPMYAQPFEVRITTVDGQVIQLPLK